MSILNKLLGAVVEALLYPFRGFPAWVGLAVVSLIAAVGILLIFKRVSNQDALSEVKRKIHAGLFEIRLFNDDLPAILRAQVEILRHNLTYLRYSLTPMLWILPPLVLLMVQLQSHYGYAGLEVGEPVLVQVQFKEGSAAGVEREGSTRPTAELVLPDGLEAETGSVWIPSKREMAWRISATKPGDYELKIDLDGEVYTKSVRVRDDVVRRSPVRVAPNVIDQLLYPAEAPLPAGAAIVAISVGYPEDAAWPLMPRWMWIFFGLSMVFAFALRNRMGVTI